MAETYPLHFLDDLKLNRLPVHWLLHFNDVLDAEKLQTALNDLLQIEGWRKLGGHLRSKKGKLSIEVTRPSFLFHHERLDIKVAQHALAASFGNKTADASVQPLPSLKPLIIVPGAPEKFKDWLKKDVPLLAVRVTTFLDGTFVSLSWPHSLMDASGARALLQAWSLVIAGKAVPPLFGINEDVLSSALSHDEGKEMSSLRQWRLKGFGKVEWILRYVFHVVWDNHPEVQRIYLPRHAMAQLRAQVTDGAEKVWISDHSILTAWLARAASGGKPLTLLSSTNARFRLKEVEDGAYIQNMILPTFTFLSRDDFEGTPGEIALAQQRQMEERTTESQTLATLSMFQKAYQGGKNPLLKFIVGEKDATYLAFNNLTKMGVHQITDFASAVLVPAKERQNPLGTPTNLTVHTEPEKLSAFVAITGKDHAKDYWMIGTMKPKVWRGIEREVAALSAQRDGAMKVLLQAVVTSTELSKKALA